MGSKPTHLIRNENIQFTATTCKTLSWRSQESRRSLWWRLLFRVLVVVPVWSQLSHLPCMWGHHGRSGALMALTEHGAVKARSCFKRVPESDRFVVSELEKLKGLPWILNGSLEAQRLERPLIAGPDALGIPILPVPAGLPQLPPKMQERRMYVTSADVRKYGGSEGCQACTQVYTWSRTNVLQSDACRRRIQELLKGKRRRKGKVGCLEKAKSKRSGS